MQYYGGCPRITYEAMLQNVCTRMQMYVSLPGHKYNQRSLGTLDIENKFSYASVKCQSSSGVPTLYEFEKLVAKMTRLSLLKSNPHRQVHLNLINS